MTLPKELEAIRDKKIWVNYPMLWEDGGHNGQGAYRKPPINPHTLRNASPTDSRTWADFETANANIGKTAIYTNKDNKNVECTIHGVGIALYQSGVFGLDLDSVVRVDDEGKRFITKEAREIIDELGTYVEVSPSQTGLHVLCLGKIDIPDVRYSASGKQSISNPLFKRSGKFEIYKSGKYLTVTGDTMGGYSLKDCTESFKETYKKHFVTPESAPPVVSSDKSTAAQNNAGNNSSSGFTREKWLDYVRRSSEDEVLQGIFKSGNVGRKVEALYYGDMSDYNNGHSEADLALVTYLYCFTGDDALTMSLFEKSSLVREKWTDRKDYRDRTLRRAKYSYVPMIGHIEFTAEEKRLYAAQKEFEEQERLNRITERRAALPNEEQSADHDQEQSEQLPRGLLVYDDIVNEFKNAEDDIIELPSFPEFTKIAKIRKHSTVAIAADTGGGKSSLAINLMNDLNDEYPCIYFNLEMDRLTLLRRLVAIQSGIELDRIEEYKNDEQTAAAVNVYIKNITSRQPIQVIQDVYMLDQIESIIVEASARNKPFPTMVFIDHSLLVELEGRTASRYERFTTISEKLRKIALKNEVVLFVLLQQNRSGKSDDEEKPKNSSLKESGSWENDASHICFLWWDPTIKRKKLLLTKNRGGDYGEFILDYWKKTQTYRESIAQSSLQPAAALGGAELQKKSKRDKGREKLQRAYESAAITTFGNVTLQAMAEAADVTTATIRGWLKEYGGCTIDGRPIDPAGIDTEVEYTGFVKLTPADDVPFDDPNQGKDKPSDQKTKDSKNKKKSDPDDCLGQV